MSPPYFQFKFKKNLNLQFRHGISYFFFRIFIWENLTGKRCLSENGIDQECSYNRKNFSRP